MSHLKILLTIFNLGTKTTGTAKKNLVLILQDLFELLNTKKKMMSNPQLVQTHYLAVKPAAGPDALSCSQTRSWFRRTILHPLPAPLSVTKHRNTPAKRRLKFRNTISLS
jgi:hypothetical protein